MPTNRIILQIERSWGKWPGWFETIEPRRQWDLYADYLIDRGPESPLNGLHPSLLSDQLTPTALLQMMAMILPQKKGPAPVSSEEFARQMGWVEAQ